MVNNTDYGTHVIYLTENKNVQSVKCEIEHFEGSGWEYNIFKFSVSQRFVICGVVHNGNLVDVMNTKLNLSCLTPYEFYLCRASNVDYLPDLSQFRKENTQYQFDDRDFSPA